jgi:mRNA interferase MazF
MNFRRGDIVYVAVKGPYTSKPRPVVVVQATATLEMMESVSVCPITSVEVDATFVRVPLTQGERTGLDRPSWIMADKIVTMPRAALKLPAVGGSIRASCQIWKTRSGTGWLYSR